ncbi:MAG: alpha/beta hydrolase [Verrucomicrobiota bacterium]
MNFERFSLVCFLGISLLATAVLAADVSAPIALWPSGAPGETNLALVEHDTTQPSDNLIAGKPLIRLGDVTRPTLTVYRPASGKQNGAAVVVCPGGGYNILAYDLEGTEVCEWLDSIGVTGVLLKYRVPAREGAPKYVAPLQDVQRAMGILRSRSSEFGIDPHRIGVLGFSAGGHLCATLCAQSATRAYPRVDAADEQSCRPDFQLLIYPGGLVHAPADASPGAEVAVSSHTPPTFLLMAQDDRVRVENVLRYAESLQESKVPFELHIYPTGGHGYGLRRTDNPITTWPDRAADWMRSRGWLNPSK